MKVMYEPPRMELIFLQSDDVLSFSNTGAFSDSDGVDANQIGRPIPLW